MAKRKPAPDAPRKPTFAEKQLEEQNRQLREQMTRLQTELDLLSAANRDRLSATNPVPQPMSKQWEWKQQEREFGRLEGKADAYAMVLNDLLELVARAMHLPISISKLEEFVNPTTK